MPDPLPHGAGSVSGELRGVGAAVEEVLRDFQAQGRIDLPTRKALNYALRGAVFHALNDQGNEDDRCRHNALRKRGVA